MNHRIAVQRLVWKEFRQLVPLLLMLPLITLLILFIVMAQELTGTAGRPHIAQTIAVILIGFPGLYAAGVGALLVGYEKEQRTLDWLRSLPIAPSKLIGVKLGVALAGLVLLWAISALFAVSIGSFTDPRPTDRRHPVDLPLYTLYVLPASFALAWYCRSALVALLWVVPVAMLPLVAANLINSAALSNRILTTDQAPGTLLGCQLVGAVIAFWAAIALGRRHLAPEASSASDWLRRWTLVDRFRSARQLAGYGAIASPMTALVWQFARQNRRVLIGLALLLAASVVTISVDDLQTSRTGWAGMAGLLATSWLGVIVFQGDAIGQRIRFLADRGLSPTTVWWTRQLVPLVLLVSFIMIGLVLVLVTHVRGPLWDIGLPILVSAAVLLSIYSVSQWFSQLFASPILAAIGAPIVSLLAYSWGGSMIVLFGTPIWLVALLAVLPMIVTWKLARRWMDRRFGAGFWCFQGGLVGSVILLPIVPLFIDVARQPRMPREIAHQLEAAARGAPATTALIELTPGRLPPSVGLPGRLRHIESQLNEKSGAVSVASMRGVVLPLTGTARLLRSPLAAAPTAADDSGDEALGDQVGVGDAEDRRRLYRQTVRLALQIAQRMRQSHRLIDQDAADWVEVWLLQEVTQLGAAELLGDPLYRQGASQLADRQTRSQARRRAVALSWQQYQRDLQSRQPRGEFGGYDISDQWASPGHLRGKLLTKRRVGLAVAELWQLAKGGPEAATAERLERIAQLWGQPPSRYRSDSQLGRYLRADDLSTFVLSERFLTGLPIAGQWHADWERQAAELR